MLVLPFSVHSVTVVFDRALRIATWLLMQVYLPHLPADVSDCAPLPSQTKFLTFLFWNCPELLPKQGQALWNMLHYRRLCNWHKSSSLQSQRTYCSAGGTPTWRNGIHFSLGFFSSVFVCQQLFGNSFYARWSTNFSVVISYWSFLVVLPHIIFLLIVIVYPLLITAPAFPWELVTFKYFQKDWKNRLRYLYLYLCLPFCSVTFIYHPLLFTCNGVHILGLIVVSYVCLLVIATLFLYIYAISLWIIP